MEGNRNEEQEKGAEIRAILSFRDRSQQEMEDILDNRRIEPNLKLINMEQVEVEKIDWLLYPFIPFGKVSIVQGDPGEGKTTMVLQIIAKLTKGEGVLPVDENTETKEKITATV